MRFQRSNPTDSADPPCRSSRNRTPPARNRARPTAPIAADVASSSPSHLLRANDDSPLRFASRPAAWAPSHHSNTPPPIQPASPATPSPLVGANHHSPLRSALSHVGSSKGFANLSDDLKSNRSQIVECRVIVRGASRRVGRIPFRNHNHHPLTRPRQ